MKSYTTESGKKLITVIPGDGIGPECMDSALKILSAAGAPLEWEECLAGAKVFKAGNATGVAEETIESIKKTRVVLKAPLETPVGYGEKSANVTLRKLFETFGNIRPARELPGIDTPYRGRGLDILVVRENIEDLYAGIEYMPTPGVAQGIKLITRKGCEKIVRLAFELARAEGRKMVHCATKANIMKLTEGLFKRTFEDIAPEYPDITAKHIIVDNCAHMLAKAPEMFDVIVTTNMNGDILSDLTSGLVGGLGFAPSANLGSEIAIFEAVHGSAPDIAGQGKANPTALILSTVMMLRHLGEFEIAAKIENAVVYTLEAGVTLTGDIAPKGLKPASTSEFTDAIIANFGKSATQLKQREHKPLQMPQVSTDAVLVKTKERKVVGVDIHVESAETPDVLGPQIEERAKGTPLKLKIISNRGARVFPLTDGFTDCVDEWRCRFVAREDGAEVHDEDILTLLQRIAVGHRWVNIEKLNEFDGEPAYTKSQGEE